MPKTKWDGADDRELTQADLKNHISTEVDSNITWRQVPSGTLGSPAMTHAKWGKSVERDYQISKQH